MISAFSLRLAFVSLCAVATRSAGEVKVDINRDGKNSGTQTAEGYTQRTTASNGGTSSTGTAGLTYTLQSSDDLVTWTNYDSVVATGSVQNLPVPSGLNPAPRRFFSAIR
jgi:hypothetical protein